MSFICAVFGAPGVWAAEPTAEILTPSPAEGEIGAQVSIVVREVPPSALPAARIRFAGAEGMRIERISEARKPSERYVWVKVPKKAESGLVEVHLTVEQSAGTRELVLPAGVFTVKKRPDVEPETPLSHSPSGGYEKKAPPPAPVVNPIPACEPDLDLPIDKPEWGVNLYPDPVAPPPPLPVTPPLPQTTVEKPPTVIPPSFYGKDIFARSNSIFYVIDISSSMALEPGSYTDADGQTRVGNRLDRAKAALIKSVRSLPANFKFNIIAYDCMSRWWKPPGVRMVEATPENKESAIAWVGQMEPGGGTATGTAVAQALSIKENLLVILLTDGDPNCFYSNYEKSYTGTSSMAAHRNIIRSANEQHAEIDVFGIGAAGEFRQWLMNVASDNAGSYMDVR